MRREEVRDRILGVKNPNILLELPTSMGKSKLGLDILNKREPTGRVLIVVPRLILIGNWKEEIHKWGYDKYLPQITFVTYMSLPKKAGNWDLVIFDECHHLSERCQEALGSFTIKYAILLSATVSDSYKKDFSLLFNDLYCFKYTMRKAMDLSILPDPKVFLLPLTLNSTASNCILVKRPKGQTPAIRVNYSDRWSAQRDYPKHRLEIICTQAQYIAELDNNISYWKRRFLAGSEMAKNKWLHLCGERLKWLANQKNPTVLAILDKLKNERTLTFCNSIEQTQILGDYSINSSNKDTATNLEAFNNGRLNHITACNMLNEGMNLVNCRVGVYANLNSSDTLVIQRLGRLLRHDQPVIILPYFKGTREEELIGKMTDNCSDELITVVHTVNEINI